MSNHLSAYIEQIDWDGLFNQLVSKLLAFLLLGILFWIGKHLIKFGVKKVLTPSLKVSVTEVARQKTILRLIENTLNYALYFILIYSVLAILGLPVSSLLAGAGIAGVAIGLGAQGFLSDLVNGFFILLEHQFDVGDFVRLTNGLITISGNIVSVGIRTTQVRDADGTLHFIPNRNILVVSNQSRGDMRAQIDIPLHTNTDLEKIYQIIEEVNKKELPNYPEIKDVNILGPHTSTAGQFSFRVNLFVTHGQQKQIYHTFYGLYQEAIRQAGMELPTLSAISEKKK